MTIFLGWRFMMREILQSILPDSKPDPVEQMGTVGVYPHLLLADTKSQLNSE
jgi:hypothetical protein